MSKEYRQQENLFNPFLNGVFPPKVLAALQILHICTATDLQPTGLCAWEELNSCKSPCKIHANSHSSFAFITLIKYLLGGMFTDSHSATFCSEAGSWNNPSAVFFCWVWIYFRIGFNMEYRYSYSVALIIHPNFTQCTHVSGVLCWTLIPTHCFR